MRFCPPRTMWMILYLSLAVLKTLARGMPESEKGSLSEVDYEPNRDYFPVKAEIKYAEGFSVTYHQHYKHLRVTKPWPQARVTFDYLLVQRGTPAPSGYAAAQIIQVPVRSVVTMTTTYLNSLELLRLEERLLGHDNFKYVYSPRIRRRIRDGSLKDVRAGTGVNLELLLELEPELILTYGMGNEWDSHPKLQEAGLKFALGAAWVESSPLGRAEWIKFVALFFNREQEAEAIFQRIAEEYENLVSRTREVQDKPTVFLGAPYQDNWWMAGGNSFPAWLLRDAGAEFLWREERVVRLSLDVEAVYERALQAEYWLNTGTWTRLADALAVDERFAGFAAFQAGRLYNNNARLNSYGGNDFWESGPANPHLILKDLIKIFHPELVPGHQFVYYRKLE